MNTQNNLYQKMTEVGYYQHVKNVIESEDTYNVYFDLELGTIHVAQGNGNCPTCWEFDMIKFKAGEEYCSLPGFKTSMQRYLFYQRLKRKKQ